ncbi:MAG: hypothetical protein LJE66_12155 [Desulfobacterales bacterium]|nr:hypothetical protein [Desulfobacterales bacterium]
MTDDIKELIAGRPFFCSWSGRKDSCLALYHAIQYGGKARSPITVLSEGDVTPRSHGLHKSLINKQAESWACSRFFARPPGINMKQNLSPSFLLKRWLYALYR